MRNSNMLGLVALSATIALGGLQLSAPAQAAAVPGPSSAVEAGGDAEAPVEAVQWRPGPRAYGPRFVPGPRYYAPGPRFYGPPRAYGGPAWGYRPWYRRPYYGTIIGGIALGTIIGVAAYGYAPRPPRPDLCWYWADEIQSRGYWDYC